MRAVVQRVERASISVDNRQISRIGKGILVFLGIEKGDRQQDADYLIDKTINLRIFEDEQGKMNRSVLDVDAEVLVISQFTLLGDCRKGRRPSFTNAEEPAAAKDLYLYFLRRGSDALGKPVQGGEFQTMMKIENINEGPVTIMLDSRKLF
jgi:D-tyrosyl-tRNA(Tyr) deacylase